MKLRGCQCRFDPSSLCADKGIWVSDRIYQVHDEAKDKEFELEMTWVSPESGLKHVPVPKELLAEAERKAKEAISNEMEDD